MHINYRFWKKQLLKIKVLEYSFNNLSGVLSFFSKYSQRMSVLEDISANHRVLSPSTARWNFKSRTVNTIYAMKGVLIQCCTELQISQFK